MDGNHERRVSLLRMVIAHANLVITWALDSADRSLFAEWAAKRAHYRSLLERLLTPWPSPHGAATMTHAFDPHSYYLVGEDGPELIIPQKSIEVRKIAVFLPVTRDLIGPWTPAEEEQDRQKSARLAAERAAESQRLHARHAELLPAHADQPVLTALLNEHGPHDSGHGDQECHGCPVNFDNEYGESHQAWPCPTWRTITDVTAQQGRS